MQKNLTPKLKSYKEELNFLHKKIGEIEWEIATISYGRKSFHIQERDTLEDQLENYQVNIRILVEKIRNAVIETKISK